jgi:drug/metabolite transporter (DMT)-like permease
MLRSLDRPALLAAIIAPLAWGMTGMLFHQGHGLPTATIAAGRLLVAFGLLLPFAWLQRRDFWKSMRNPLAAAMGAYYVLATEALADGRSGAPYAFAAARNQCDFSTNAEVHVYAPPCER